MEIRPIGKRALIEQVSDEKTVGGLIIPEGADKKPIGKGVVRAVWAHKELKVGDVVLYKKWALDEVEINNVKYSILKTRDILAILEEE